jgi:hypothetical protein
MKGVISCLFVVIAASCSEQDQTGVQLKLEETACANPWGVSSEISAITEYLQSEGVHPLSINRKNTAPQDALFCAACICANGWTIFIVVKSEEEEKARELGFF